MHTLGLVAKRYRSLYWMQQRESEVELFDLTLHRVRVDPLNSAASAAEFVTRTGLGSSIQGKYNPISKGSPTTPPLHNRLIEGEPGNP